jgi:hypothetical protein
MTTEERGLVAKLSWRTLALVGVMGVCIALVSGFVENRPEASVFVHKYYGFPLVWRITTTFVGEEYLFFELFVDCLFWIAVVFVLALLARALLKE